MMMGHLVGVEISHLVEDIAEKKSTQSVVFMQKYGLTEAEWSQYEFAALPAINYRSRLESMKNRMQVEKNEYTKICADAKVLNETLKSPVLEKLIERMEIAIYNAGRAFEWEKSYKEQEKERKAAG